MRHHSPNCPDTMDRVAALVAPLIERCDLALGDPVWPVKQSGGWQSKFRRPISYS